MPFTHGTCSRDAASERTGRAQRTLQRCTTQQELNYNDLDARAEDGGKLPSRGEREREKKKKVGWRDRGGFVFFFLFSFLSSNSVHIYRSREDGKEEKKLRSPLDQCERLKDTVAGIDSRR